MEFSPRDEMLSRSQRSPSGLAVGDGYLEASAPRTSEAVAGPKSDLRFSRPAKRPQQALQRRTPHLPALAAGEGWHGDAGSLTPSHQIRAHAATAPRPPHCAVTACLSWGLRRCRADLQLVAEHLSELPVVETAFYECVTPLQPQRAPSRRPGYSKRPRAGDPTLRSTLSAGRVVQSARHAARRGTRNGACGYGSVWLTAVPVTLACSTSNNVPSNPSPPIAPLAVASVVPSSACLCQSVSPRAPRAVRFVGDGNKTNKGRWPKACRSSMILPITLRAGWLFVPSSAPAIPGTPRHPTAEPPSPPAIQPVWERGNSIFACLPRSPQMPCARHARSRNTTV